MRMISLEDRLRILHGEKPAGKGRKPKHQAVPTHKSASAIHKIIEKRTGKSGNPFDVR